MTRYEDLIPLSPLSMAILLALADGDRHGYALMEEVAAQSGGLLRPGTGSLYSALRRLLNDELVMETQGEPGADRRRRYYGITTLGRYAAGAEARRLLKVLNLASQKDIRSGLLPVPAQVRADVGG